jgi:hypothetical protein
MASQRSAVLTATLLLTLTVAGGAFGDVRHETTERRPYIVEIGDPYSISRATLQREAQVISALREHLELYGYPDYAEIQEIQPDWPWTAYEVRLYYMRRNLEADYGHVNLSVAALSFGLLKFVGDIPADKRHQIEETLQSRSAPPAGSAVAMAAPPPAGALRAGGPRSAEISEALVGRVEAAAERAAQAADRAVQESDAAARAADRTVNIVDKMEHQAPTKRHHGH